MFILQEENVLHNTGCIHAPVEGIINTLPPTPPVPSDTTQDVERILGMDERQVKSVAQ